MVGLEMAEMVGEQKRVAGVARAASSNIGPALAGCGTHKEQCVL